MKSEGVQGSIVHVSTNASTHSEPIITIYSALKAALDHFTNLMAVELGPLNVCLYSYSVKIQYEQISAPCGFLISVI